LFQLAIDENPDCLECLGRWMNSAILRRSDRRNQLRQLTGPCNCFGRARCNNCTCNPARKSLFTEFSNDSLQSLFIHARKPFGRADSFFRVHSHVERSVQAEAEAASGFIQLWRRDAQIE